jgi:ribosomal-protein-alanine N-acetyltransferase
MIYFETERLNLRDWKETDLQAFRLMNKDKRVMEFLPGILSDRETDSFYTGIKDEFLEFGYGLFAAEVKGGSEFIGYIGFHRATFEASFTPCIEIGWRLKFEAWGRGYATEGAKACLRYGFDTLDLERVYSFTSKQNSRSENVMKKIGMSKITEFDHPKLDESSVLRRHVLYGLTQTEWRMNANAD